MKKFLFLLLAFHTAICFSQSKTENVIIITLDGLRWQELFGGADSILIRDKNFVDDTTELINTFWAGTPTERRKKLLPFIWSTIAEQGQIHGNRIYGSKVNVKNAFRVSYPGYNEIFTGYPDSLIANNDKNYNKNITVLGWLNEQPALKNSVAVFTSWDVFNFIFNEKRNSMPVNAGIDDVKINTPAFKQLNEMQRNTFQPFGKGVRPDLLTYHLAKEYIKEKKPKVLYIGFDDTDDWAHNGKYDYYLQSANLTDGYIADLWQMLQDMPQYKNKTTLILTTDHGRGDVIKKEWTSHGKKIAGADQTWMALYGNSVPSLGEVKVKEQFYQAQIAQTIAQLLGYKFSAAHPVEPAVSSIGK
jgi:hypothetical protein